MSNSACQSCCSASIPGLRHNLVSKTLRTFCLAVHWKGKNGRTGNIGCNNQTHLLLLMESKGPAPELRMHMFAHTSDVLTAADSDPSHTDAQQQYHHSFTEWYHCIAAAQICP